MVQFVFLASLPLTCNNCPFKIKLSSPQGADLLPAIPCSSSPPSPLRVSSSETIARAGCWSQSGDIILKAFTARPRAKLSKGSASSFFLSCLLFRKFGNYFFSSCSGITLFLLILDPLWAPGSCCRDRRKMKGLNSASECNFPLCHHCC